MGHLRVEVLKIAHRRAYRLDALRLDPLLLLLSTHSRQGLNRRASHIVHMQQVPEQIQPRRYEHRPMVVRPVVHDLVCRARDVCAQTNPISPPIPHTT